MRIRELEKDLAHVGGLSAANLVRDTVDDFKRKILQSRRGRKYLSANAQETAENIRNAYSAFLNDQRNPKSRSLRAALTVENISEDDFIDCCMHAYTRTSSIIHTCAQAFRTLHSLDEYLVAIDFVSRLSVQEKSGLKLIASVLPY